MTPTDKVVVCTINQETKAFENCVDAGGTNINTPVSVIVNNGLVYINDQSLLNTAGDMITVCSQGADGALTNCAKTSSYSAVKSTQGLAISGNYIYIGNAVEHIYVYIIYTGRWLAWALMLFRGALSRPPTAGDGGPDTRSRERHETRIYVCVCVCLCQHKDAFDIAEPE